MITRMFCSGSPATIAKSVRMRVRRLRREVDRRLTGHGVDVGERSRTSRAATGWRARVERLERDDLVGGCEGRVGRRLVAGLPVDRPSCRSGLPSPSRIRTAPGSRSRCLRRDVMAWSVSYSTTMSSSSVDFAIVRIGRDHRRDLLPLVANLVGRRAPLGCRPRASASTRGPCCAISSPVTTATTPVDCRRLPSCRCRSAMRACATG